MPRPLSKGEAKHLRSLTTKKGRESSGQVLVEGWKAVDELLSSPWTVESVIVHLQRVPPHGATVLSKCVDRLVEVRSGTAADLRAVSDVQADQGIVAIARRPSVTLASLPPTGDILVLDGVSDPGNVGTLIRTADWFGLTAIVLGPGCASVANAKVLRSTMGSAFHLPVADVEDLVTACRALAANGLTLVTAEVEGGKWPSWAPRTRLALVLGSEAHGVSDAVRMLATQRVSIPRRGHAESLNVAAAGAVLLASLAEQRHA